MEFAQRRDARAIEKSLFTLLQRATPAPLPGRTFSAVELLVGVPQTLSIAAGAMLVAIVDYRLLLLVERRSSPARECG